MIWCLIIIANRNYQRNGVACVALTTIISSTHPFTGQCRARGYDARGRTITIRLTRVRGTGQQPAGSSGLVLTSATHTTRSSVRGTDHDHFLYPSVHWSVPRTRL